MSAKARTLSSKYFPANTLLVNIDGACLQQALDRQECLSYLVRERLISTKTVLGVAGFGFCSLPQLPQPVAQEGSPARFARNARRCDQARRPV
jgi:hypothetical protein